MQRSPRTLIDRLIGPQQLTLAEIALATVSALVTLLLIAFISKRLLVGVGVPFIVASMGATAVLLFAAPASSMTSPWAVVAGHLASAVVGVTCAQYIGALEWAAPIAGAGAILVMLLLRALHPPGGATAMLIVLGGEPMYAAGYQFILTPIALNVLILCCATLMIRLISRRCCRRQEGESSESRL